MLSSVSRLAPTLSRATVRVGSVSKRSMLSLGDTIKGKEKVEEDRYMRAQDEVWKEKLRKLKALEEHEKVETLHQSVVEPVMEDVAAMLAATGDTISKDGLETIAKWKLDL